MALQLWIEIGENTPFDPGDVYIKDSHLVLHNDGDRALFEPGPRMTIRPVKDQAIDDARREIAKELRRLADKLDVRLG